MVDGVVGWGAVDGVVGRGAVGGVLGWDVMDGVVGQRAMSGGLAMAMGVRARGGAPHLELRLAWFVGLVLWFLGF